MFHRENEVLRQGSGIAVEGATVTVYVNGTDTAGDYSAATKAPIYPANVVAGAIANSTLTTDEFGHYAYYVPSGVYDEVLTYGSIVKVDSYIQMFDMAGFTSDAEAFAEAAEDSAEAAAASATSALASKNDAAASATAAANSAADAATSATTAGTARDGAVAAQLAAETSANASETSASNAAISETNAAASAVAAAASAAAASGGVTAQMTASEVLIAHSFVNIHASAGVAKIRYANATDDTKPVNGFVPGAIGSGSTNTMIGPGAKLTGLAGLTPGVPHYLSTVNGTLTDTPPAVAGNLVQEIGLALSATELLFNPKQGITL